jgi:hypothetical protein
MQGHTHNTDKYANVAKIKYLEFVIKLIVD